MAEPAAFEDTRGDDAKPAGQSPPGAPRWVKVTAIVIVVVVLALIVSKLAGVEHGPGRHGGSDGQTPSSVVAPDAASSGQSSGGQVPRAGGEGHARPAGVRQHDAP